jgi:hypothetical protein
MPEMWNGNDGKENISRQEDENEKRFCSGIG